MSTPLSTYPNGRRGRDQWVLSRRAPRNLLDPQRPYAFFAEEERAGDGRVVPVATVFLTNRECPWRCVMCDLWRNTLTEVAPIGAIPAQIDFALAGLPRARQIKLYNSGSFFDSRAIPPADYEPIARRVSGFDRVIVECHPSLVGDACLRFRDLLGPTLEVAMGLETAHPEALEKLNKRMTIDQFARASAFLAARDIALRVFLLVHPPFIAADEAADWARRSIEFAFECGATAVSLIPTRASNGAMETLASMGHFAPPRLVDLESAAEYGVCNGRGRVFTDLWDLDKFSDCPHCLAARTERLREQNLSQRVSPRVCCDACGAGHAR